MATSKLEVGNVRFAPAANLAAHSVRTLLVDDTPAMLQTLSALLNADQRIEIVGTAANGLAAVEMAQSERPDLVLMDINMPKMDGLKAAMHIKRRFPETRILLMSADDDPGIALAAVNCGADGFVPKSQWRHCRWHVERLFFSL